MSPRGSTGSGRPTKLPQGKYVPQSMVVEDVVRFVGDDGRSRSFDVGSLPLPGWHAALAASWETRIGPTGSLRTLSSANTSWGSLSRLVRFLDSTLQSPQKPEDLLVAHVEAYRRFVASTSTDNNGKRELRIVAPIFEQSPLADRISPEVRDSMRPMRRMESHPVSGYSDGELAKIVAAAKSSVAAIRDRLDNERIVPVFKKARLQDDEPVSACETSKISRRAAANIKRDQLARAKENFIVWSDLTPLLVLLVARTGWNIEVIKELPAEHRILDGLAVEVLITKRRRGAAHWHQKVTWEIGPEGRELSTPGGVYLLIHRLMSKARALAPENPSIWRIWRPSIDGRTPHFYSPFSQELASNLDYRPWIKEWKLTADGPEEGSHRIAPRLRLNFNRLKTSIDVRRTRLMGGHLPSAARSNTTGVLFRNYLSGDKTTIDWARDVVSEVLVDVEKAAWKAHRRALAMQGIEQLQVDVHVTRPADVVDQSDLGGIQATPWASCADFEHHPLTQKRCASSFLDCFHCGNCVVTDDHLPSLLGLLDAFESLRSSLSEESWWRKYGPAWAAIRYEVLPKFTESEVREAETVKPVDSLLDLVEPFWDRP